MPLPQTPAAAICLQDVRASLEGGVPAVMTTCDAFGVPNVTLASQVYYVDAQHVALSFQFFNKTYQNIRSNPQACVQLIDPVTGVTHQLLMRYVRTETQGPLFESMRAQLAGIASHLGMSDVYSLRGSDVYVVEEIAAVEVDMLPAASARHGLLTATRQTSERLARCTGLDELIDAVLASLNEYAGVQHAMVLINDKPSNGGAGTLFTVGSIGYADSGVGSEVPMGQGVIGTAAAACTPVRINRVSPASSYNHAVRHQLQTLQPGLVVDIEIPYPGLLEPHSQLAVPLVAGGSTLGVLFVESTQELAFSFEDEDLLMSVAAQLAASIGMFRGEADESGARLGAPGTSASTAPALTVKHYAINDSVFVDNVYLIKGVAGAILWKLLRQHSADQRTEFTNRELRLDTSLGLPEVDDNLEARLLLLRRRLQDKSPHIHLERASRGCISLQVERPLVLLEISS